VKTVHTDVLELSVASADATGASASSICTNCKMHVHSITLCLHPTA
jgi:hypothetical protein